MSTVAYTASFCTILITLVGVNGRSFLRPYFACVCLAVTRCARTIPLNDCSNVCLVGPQYNYLLKYIPCLPLLFRAERADDESTQIMVCWTHEEKAQKHSSNVIMLFSSAVIYA